MNQSDQSELQYTRDSLARIANLFGIEDPMQLIALADNNEDTYTDLLIKHISTNTGEAIQALQTIIWVIEADQYWAEHLGKEQPRDVSLLYAINKAKAACSKFPKFINKEQE